MSVPRIAKEDLKARLEGDPANLPVILDARLKYPLRAQHPHAAWRGADEPR